MKTGTIISMINDANYQQFVLTRLGKFAENMPLDKNGKGQFFDNHSNSISSTEAIGLTADGEVVCLTSKGYCSLNPMKIREDREGDIKVTLSTWAFNVTFYPKHGPNGLSWKLSAEEFNKSLLSTSKRYMLVGIYVFPTILSGAIPVSRYNWDEEMKDHNTKTDVIGQMFHDRQMVMDLLDEHRPFGSFINPAIQVISPMELSYRFKDLQNWNPMEEKEPQIYVEEVCGNKYVYFYTNEGDEPKLFRAGIIYKK